MMIRTVLVLLPIAALLAGCKTQGSGDNYVPKKKAPLASGILAPGEEAAYFPLNVGNQWTYTYESKVQQGNRVMTGNPIEVTYKITKVTKEPKGKFAVLEIYTEDKLSDRQVWHVDNTGIYQVAMGKNLVKFSSPQPIVKFPIKEGATFSWNGTGTAGNGTVGQLSVKSTMTGEQPVDAAGSTFNGIDVSSTGTIKTNKVQAKTVSDVWFVPNVGLVRYQQSATGKSADGKTTTARVEQLRLKSYSLKH